MCVKLSDVFLCTPDDENFTNTSSLRGMFADTEELAVGTGDLLDDSNTTPDNGM